MNVSWSPPSDGASVTGYVVHYRSLLHEGTLAVFQNTSVLIDGVIAEGRFYEIIVEAQSIHLSGYSLPVPFGSCMFTFVAKLRLSYTLNERVNSLLQ